MPWNWELPEWPKFNYDPDAISQQERQFLLGVGSAFAYLKTIDEQEYNRFIVEILSLEGWRAPELKGRSLIEKVCNHPSNNILDYKLPKEGADKESGMAQLLCNVYESFDKPLTHEMLWKWHSMLIQRLTH